MAKSNAEAAAPNGEALLVAEMNLANEVAKSDSVAETAATAEDSASPVERRPAPAALAGGNSTRRPAAGAVSETARAARLPHALWVVLATLATLALCAWLAHGLYERQARLADAQRLGVFRDLQASRVIEYFDNQSEAMRLLAQLGIPGRFLAEPGQSDTSETLGAPVFNRIANRAHLTHLAVIDAETLQIQWAGSDPLAGRIGASLEASSAADLPLINALENAVRSPDGLNDDALAVAQFVRFAPFAADGSDAQKQASLVTWLTAPMTEGGGRYLLLAQSSFSRLLEHLEQTAVNPSPFTNETPQTRLLVGKNHDGLNAALLRESQRTSARIMSVTNDQSGEPALAAVRRLDIAGNPMTLAILQGHISVFEAVKPLLWPLLAGILLIAGLFGSLAYRYGRTASKVPPRLLKTIKALRAGDYSMRTELRGNQDPNGIAEALDRVLDERAAAINEASRESAELNASVVRIMETVGTIATSRDLTMRVPVTEDVTGAISDALNMLTEETSRAMAHVSGVAQEVARATLSVKSQGELAEQHIGREREEVSLAVGEVATAAQAIGQATSQAAAAEQDARRADSASLEASRTVRATANGVLKARDLIRQAEKRVKRLGEHSQEIGQVVGIIESISERTGILALNTSLQAAAAGEAGRQFAGLADEVKRLSRSAGQATAQIGRMVSAIQTETAETVGAVGSAIGQIVEISDNVAKADSAMGETRNEIEAVVTRIATLSTSVQEQAALSLQLQDRAARITTANADTLRELQGQGVETNKLVECARTLLKEVGAFKTGSVR